MNLEELRTDCSLKQKKGLHFILASIVIWCAILVVQLLEIPVLTKNLLTFCCTAPLAPLAFLISKMIKVDFQSKENPLTNLGILFALNQIVYLLIAMWIYYEMPDKMIMVIAIIFGAHLMPFSWLYRSKTYLILSIVIPVASLIAGLNFPPYILAIMMIAFEMIFSVCLIFENKMLKESEQTVS